MSDKDLQHLAAIVRDSDDAIIGKTLKGIITSWNGGAERIYGYTAEEAIGRSVSMLVPLDREDELPKIMEALSRGEGRNHYDTLRVTKDGRLLNISLTISPISNKSGVMIGASSIGRDVTKQKEAEEALRQSAKAYRLLMEQASDAILVSYPDHTTVEINERASELFGYTREELREGTVRDGAIPAQLDEILTGKIAYPEPAVQSENDAGGLRARTPAFIERPVRRKDGTTIVTELSARQLEDGRVVTIARDVTARKEAERALRESEERYRAIVEDQTVLVSRFLPDGTFTFLNQAACLAWGQKLEDILGQSIFQYLPDAERELFGEHLSAFSLDNTLLTKESRIASPDGAMRYWQWTLKALFDEQGTLREFQQVSVDITERKIAEERLQKRELQLSEAQEIAHVGSWETHLQTGETTWSNELYRIYGVEPQSHDASSGHFMGYIHPDDRRSVRKELTRVTKKGGSFKYEHRVVRPDGTTRIVCTQGKVTIDCAGRPDRMVGTEQDITERRKAEAALQNSEERYRLMFSGNPVPMWVYDAETLRFLEVNEAAVLYYGYTRKEFLGMGIKDIRPKADVEILLQDLKTPHQYPRVSSEWRHLLKSGKIIDAEITSHNFTFDGRPAMLVVARDVTERKLAEQVRCESEQRYRQMFEGNGAVQWLLDPATGAIIQANQAASDFYGYPCDELEGMNITDFNRSLGKAAAIERLQQMSQQAMTIVGRHTLASGEIRDIEGRTGPVDIDGRRLVHCIITDITERKRAESALLANEEKFRGIFEHTLDAVFITDSAGRFVEVNPAASLLTGLPREDLVGRSFAEFPRWEPTTNLSRVQDEVEEQGGSDGSLHFVNSDGEVRDVDYFSIANFIPGYHLSVAHDLTERRRSELALKASEIRYRSLIETSPDAISLTDLQGTILICNQQTVTLHEYSSIEEIVGKNALEMIAPEDQGRATDDIGRVVANGFVRDLEYTLVKKDGSYFPAEVNGSITFDAAGEPNGLMSIVRDITGRKQAQDRLQKSEELYRSLARNLPDGAVFMFNADLRFELVEGAALEVHGYSKESLEGKTIWEVLPPESCEVLVPYYQAALAGQEKTLDTERDGFWYTTRFVPVKNEQGGTFAGMAVSLDVTEQKHAEVARIAQQAAEQANRAKSEFLSRMSHELRTPLNAVLGFGQLLQMDVKTPDLQESVGYILKAGRHLLNLINDVLEIARIEEGKLDMSLEPVLALDVLQESLNLVRPLATRRNITIEEDIASMGNCCVLADRQALQQVSLNLITNALKYNREGGAVTLSCITLPGSIDDSNPVKAGGTGKGERIRISVSDTGRGLSADQVARLFTPFERVGAEEGDVEGTGLGLALSKHLVEAMGGTIGVESEPGKGSTFWVELDPASVPATPPDPSVTGPLFSIQLREQARTVLYIEDNLSNLRLVAGILNKQPAVTLITAPQGQLGIEMALEHQPDLILLDLHLPDIPGGEVLRRLQSEARTSLIPVVMLSADANPQSAAKLLGGGAYAYLTKPLDVQQLLKVLDTILAQSVG